MLTREIRAIYDKETITVYQAYQKSIALVAVKHQKFVSPFKMERMTWIKPSFLWMMYRCGWASKENQEYVLAIKIKREGFEWALKNACLSHFVAELYQTEENWKQCLSVSPVRIQWDPEKNIYLHDLEYRSIQIGLTGIAVQKYVNEWTVDIEDITEYAKEIGNLVNQKKIEEAQKLLPIENIYPVSEDLKLIIGHS
ncbi:hypothetical protein AD998_14925 [bacterium 336/3]|nr:hypothetical protein AD998_14925 [bacterium 336/3]